MPEVHKCPICRKPMKFCGKLMMKNPGTGKKRLVDVMRCTVCNYRTMV